MLSVAGVLLSVLTSLAGEIDLRVDPATGEPGKFAAEEIRRAVRCRVDRGEEMHGLSVLLTIKSREDWPAESYRLQVENKNQSCLVTIEGTDPTGAMFGGLDVAEAVRSGFLLQLRDSEHRPYIQKRGIKFNIPLDLRTPSYSDCSDAAQANIPVVWEREFWAQFLDAMARYRYNVLTLWNLHPFPSLVKVPEFPEVALEDVWRTRVKLDDSFSFLGTDMVRPSMLAEYEVVKRMTIEEKIAF
jgi:hypothetical protein